MPIILQMLLILNKDSIILINIVSKYKIKTSLVQAFIYILLAKLVNKQNAYTHMRVLN